MKDKTLEVPMVLFHCSFENKVPKLYFSKQFACNKNSVILCHCSFENKVTKLYFSNSVCM